jgi:hypothetical protein
MKRIVPAGIPQHFWKQEQEMKHKIKFENEDNKKVLSLEDLEYGFVMWIVACAISTAVFLDEFLRPKLKKFVRASVGLFYFMKLLRVRLI